MMYASTALTTAKALIDTPEKWTQGDMARDRRGNGMSATEPGAVCFCSLGALSKIVNGNGLSAAYRHSVLVLGEVMANEKLSDYNLAFRHIHHYNDKHTHHFWMGMFDRAIEIAKKRESNENL